MEYDLFFFDSLISQGLLTLSCGKSNNKMAE